MNRNYSPLINIRPICSQTWILQSGRQSRVLSLIKQDCRAFCKILYDPSWKAPPLRPLLICVEFLKIRCLECKLVIWHTTSSKMPSIDLDLMGISQSALLFISQKILIALNTHIIIGHRTYQIREYPFIFAPFAKTILHGYSCGEKAAMSNAPFAILPPRHPSRCAYIRISKLIYVVVKSKGTKKLPGVGPVHWARVVTGISIRGSTQTESSQMSKLQDKSKCGAYTKMLYIV